MNLYVILLCSYNFSGNGKKTSLRNYPINLSINSSKTYQLRLSKIQISIFTLPPGGPGGFWTHWTDYRQIQFEHFLMLWKWNYIYLLYINMNISSIKNIPSPGPACARSRCKLLLKWAMEESDHSTKPWKTTTLKLPRCFSGGQSLYILGHIMP